MPRATAAQHLLRRRQRADLREGLRGLGVRDPGPRAEDPRRLLRRGARSACHILHTLDTWRSFTRTLHGQI